MSGSVYTWKGSMAPEHVGSAFGLSQPAGSLRFQPNNEVLQGEMRWPHVFIVFFHCIWVYKGRTDMSERVCRLGRGTWRHKHVRFGVSQFAGFAQISAEQ